MHLTINETCVSLITMRIGTFLLTFPIAYAWPVAHMVNSQTSPTVRITLDPPEDPLPQVTARMFFFVCYQSF